MQSSTRVAINTSVQYARTIISVIITLYTSRIILANLGVDDYGIYSLVGGVIALLAFIQNNLAQTTQRYLSYYQGRKDLQMQIKIFNNSICTQWCISLVLCLLLLSLTGVVFSHLLNISPERIQSAKWVYWMMICSLFFNMQSSPYLATLIAHENIVYSSIVQIIDAIIKLPIAFSLIWISQNKLEWYSFMSFTIVLLNFFFYYVYCKRKYAECRNFSLKSFDLPLSKEMLAFMGWGVYSTGCIAGRTQGTAILLNRFFGTAMNAAYGIAGQVSGQMSFLSNALTTAMRPQIIKAEGAGERKKMFRLSEISCKFSFLLLSIVSIPAIIYMPTILNLWLKEVPEYTDMFCRFILIANQIDLLTLNLGTANHAIGNIKMYTIQISSIKIITLPVIYIALKLQADPMIVMIIYVTFEFICAVTRVWFLHKDVQLSITQFIQNVFIPVLPIVILNSIVCWGLSKVLPGILFLVTGVVSLLFTCLCTYAIGLKADEKAIIDSMLVRILNKIRK